ncbi:MAG TPA: hypothetical protein VMF50_14200 [Candidatus Binataceae bacterium]|nr:hypothetical protein [Candidatus Binataceae bacterium]
MSAFNEPSMVSPAVVAKIRDIARIKKTERELVATREAAFGRLSRQVQISLQHLA